MHVYSKHENPRQGSSKQNSRSRERNNAVQGKNMGGNLA